jgi:hypothetical protein
LTKQNVKYFGKYFWKDGNVLIDRWKWLGVGGVVIGAFARKLGMD